MAIYGKNNIIEMVRLQQCKHIKICEVGNQKDGGNFIWKTDYENNDVSVEEVCGELRRCLDKLTAGRYHIIAQKTLNAQKGNISTTIEVESDGSRVASIGGIENNARPLFIGGTEVTATNINEVIKQEFANMQAELARKQTEENLKRENAELKKQLAEKESGINGGLMSIGAIVLPILKKTPQGKQLLAAVAGLGLSRMDVSDAPVTTKEEVASIGEAEQEEAGNRIAAALEKLNTTNALQLADELELLAKVKTESPETFNMGLDYLKGISDE